MSKYPGRAVWTPGRLFLCLYPQVVGLYRLCGSAAVKKELRDAFEQDSAAVCLSEDVYPDINVITGQHGLSPLSARSFRLSPPGWSGGPSAPSSLPSYLIFSPCLPSSHSHCRPR